MNRTPAAASISKEEEGWDQRTTAARKRPRAPSALQELPAATVMRLPSIAPGERRRLRLPLLFVPIAPSDCHHFAKPAFQGGGKSSAALISKADG